MMDKWIVELVVSTQLRFRHINPVIHASNNPIRAAVVAEIDEAFVF